MKKFFSELKDFLMRGNVVDMAVGVVVGGAFSKIVSSLVADVITPLISLLTGGQSFSELFVILNPDKFVATDTIEKVEDIVTRADAQIYGLATLNWGNFVQTIIDFLIIGISIFIVLKVMMKTREILEHKKIEAEKAAAAAKAAEEAAKPKELTTEERILAALESIDAKIK